MLLTPPISESHRPDDGLQSSDHGRSGTPHSMRKLILLLGGAALLTVLVLVAAGYFLGSIVRAAVNRYGPPITKTRVELSGAEISPLTGSGTIKGLVIGNPPGWHSARAVYLGEVHVSMKPFSIFSDHVVIKEILIDRPEFVYETRFIRSNLKDLLKNIEASTGAGGEGVETAKTKAGNPVKFEVREFSIQNARVTIGIGPAAVTVPMPEITLSDLGTETGGITANQLTAVLTEKVLSQVLLTAAGAIETTGRSAGSAAADTAISAAKRAAGDLKRLFGGKN